MSNSYSIYCYLPDSNYPGYEKFIANMKEFSSYELITFFSDTFTEHELPYVPIPKLNGKSSNEIATLTFMWALRDALAKSHPRFIVLEADCRVTCDYWDKIMNAEFNKFPASWFGGSPVIWGFDRWGQHFQKAVIRYAYNYQEQAGLPICFEGHRTMPFAFYPNGALSIYNTAALASLFQPKEIEKPADFIKLLSPYDLIIGKRLGVQYKMDCLSKVAPLTVSYSGCGNHHVTEEERVRMVKDKLKVAVHQIKRNDL